MVQWFYFDSKLHYSHSACPARCRTRCLAMSVLLLPRFFKLLGVWEQHLKVGRKPFPIAHVFFKDLKRMLHILSYIYYIIICSDPGNQGYFGKNDKSSIEWPRSSNESSKAFFSSAAIPAIPHPSFATPHLSLFCDGVLHAPVATHPPRDVHWSVFITIYRLPSLPTYCALSIWFSDSICSFCLAVSPVKRW